MPPFQAENRFGQRLCPHPSRQTIRMLRRRSLPTWQRPARGLSKKAHLHGKKRTKKVLEQNVKTDAVSLFGSAVPASDSPRAPPSPGRGPRAPAAGQGRLRRDKVGEYPERPLLQLFPGHLGARPLFGAAALFRTAERELRRLRQRPRSRRLRGGLRLRLNHALRALLVGHFILSPETIRELS